MSASITEMRRRYRWLAMISSERALVIAALFVPLRNRLQGIIDFLIIAFVIFLLVKQVNRMKEKEVAAPVAEKECPFCFTSIPIKATRCPNCTSELKAP